MSVTSETRRQVILSDLYARERVSVRLLAERLDVSEATVRRDLKALADEGRAELIHGGATISRKADFSFRSKGMRNPDAKRRIGRLAAGLVANHDQIFLDSGTTCFQMVPHLKAKRGLSVVVNSARLALELDTPEISVVLIGGQYRPDRMDTVGPLATGMIDQLRGYVAFVGADGLSPEFGLTASDIESAHFNRRAVEHARDAVLVADAGKFASPSLFKIVEFDRISRVVTDRRPEEAWMDFFAARDIEVILPAEQGPDADAQPDPPDRP
jgi:DeoR/GlpR family transcriptional regulator of sugar metabolism